MLLLLSLLPASLAQVPGNLCVAYSFTKVVSCDKPEMGVSERYLFSDATFHPHLRDPSGYVQGSCVNAERPMIDRFLQELKYNGANTDFVWGSCGDVEGQTVQMTCEWVTDYEGLQKCGYTTPNVPAPPILEDDDDLAVDLPACSIIALYNIFGKNLFDLLSESGRAKYLTPITEDVWKKDLQCQFLGMDIMHEWQSLHSTRLTIGQDAPHPLPENSDKSNQRRRLLNGEDHDNARRRDSRSTTGPSPVNLWTNGIVPYVIEAQPGDTYDTTGIHSEGTDEVAGRHDFLTAAKHQQIVDAVNEAIADFNKYTCITIRPRTTETNYIAIVWKEGCWSNSLGMRGGKQYISLGNWCFWKSIAIHEFMHAIGFEHEHKRPDRDSYLNVDLAAVEPASYQSQFHQISRDVWDPHGVGYDISSIMAYGPYDFTGDTHDPVITEMNDRQKPMVTGQRVTMSIFDSEQIKKMYMPQCGASRQPAPVVGYKRFKQTTSCGAKMAADLSATTDRSYGKPVNGVHSKAECALATLKATECYAGIFQWNQANYNKWGGCEMAYLGCYANPLPNHMLEHRVLLSASDGSLQACRDKCHEDGYRYFGRQNFDQCWCGNTYGTQEGFTQQPDATCNCELNNYLGQRAGHNGNVGSSNSNGQCYGNAGNMAVYDVCARPRTNHITDADVAGQLTEQTCGCCHAHFGYDGDNSGGYELNFLTGSGLNQYALNNPYPKPSLVLKVKTKCLHATVVHDDARDWKRCEASCYWYNQNYPSRYSRKFVWSPTLSSQRYSGLWPINAGIGCQCCKPGSPEVPSTHQILYQLNDEYTGTFDGPWDTWNWDYTLQKIGRRRLNNGTGGPMHPDDLPDAPQDDAISKLLALHEAELEAVQKELKRANMQSLIDSLTDHVIPVVEAEQQCEDDLKAAMEQTDELEEDIRQVSNVEKLGSYSSMLTLALGSTVAVTYVLWRAFCRKVVAVEPQLPKMAPPARGQWHGESQDLGPNKMPSTQM